jgi:subtilisin-like proprotein convertase family protein
MLSGIIQMRKIQLLLVGLVLGFSVLAIAAPVEVPYVGYLNNDDGTPYDGTASVVAELFAAADGGNAVTTCTVAELDVQAGVMSFVMGGECTPPLTVEMFAEDGMWLGITINDTLLEPRQKVLSVAYALQADNAQKLGGEWASEYVTSTELGDAGYVADEDLAAVATSGVYGDLTGTPDMSGYALTEDLEPICFSGSIEDLIDLDLSAFVTLEQLAAVATSGAYGDLTGAPDLTAYLVSDDLATVALSGLYSDLVGVPDLAAYVLSTDLATVALSGDYNDLINTPGAGALLADGLETISNGTMTNALTQEYKAAGLPADIGTEKEITIDISESGELLDITVDISVEHAYCPELEVRLLPPGDDTGILLVAAGEATGQAFQGQFGVDDTLALKNLLGSSTTGMWTLRVTDTIPNGNEGSGSTTEYTLTASYLAAGQVQVNADVNIDGNQYVTGGQTVMGDQVVNGNQVISGALTVGGKDVGNELTDLQSEVWCLKNCTHEQKGYCKELTCDGTTGTCDIAGETNDGALCQGGSGTCQSGSCCVPYICQVLNAECGVADNGCGGTCGECGEGQYCVGYKCPPEGKECDDGNLVDWDGCTNDGEVAEFQVNSYAYLNQTYPVVTSLGTHGFVVVWESTMQDGDNQGIVAQRFDINGEAMGVEFVVNTTTEGDQKSPAVASLSAGRFMVVWQSDPGTNPNNKADVFGQVFASNGVKSGSEFFVNDYTTHNQVGPSIAVMDNGTSFVAWVSFDQEGNGGGYGIFGRLLETDHTPNGSEKHINQFTSDDQTNIQLAPTPDGGFLAVWESDNQDNSGMTIMGRRFANNATALSSEFQVNITETGNQSRPDCVFLSNGAFVVVWDGYGPDANDTGVYARLYNSEGVATSSEILLNQFQQNNQTEARVAALSGGGFAVTWQSDGQSGEEEDIVTRVFSSTGEALGEEQIVNSYREGVQFYPSLSALADGEQFVVVWQSNIQDGGAQGIFAQRFDKDGNKLYH